MMNSHTFPCPRLPLATALPVLGLPALLLSTVSSAQIPLADGVLLSGSMDRPVAAASADIDGDGTDDLVFHVEAGQTYLQLGLGLGEFGPATLLIESVAPFASINALDIDGDGDVEIIRGGELWTPIAGGGYGMVSGPPLGAPSQIIDLDGDGVLDIILSPSFWRRGLGGLSFAPMQRLLDVTTSGLAAVIVDLDGDGDLDLVRAQFDSSLPRVAVFPGTGSIPFASAGALPIANQLPIGGSTVDIIVLDGDLDGDPDLVLGSSQSPLAYVENLGALAFDSEVVIGTGLSTELVRGADYDGDGQADLVVQTTQSPQEPPSLVAYRGLGGGSFSPANVIAESLQSFDLLALDVDGDGADEIIHVHGESRADLLDIGTIGSFSSQPLNETLAVAAAVDVDQDGRPDLVAVAEDPSRVVWKRSLADGSYDRAIEIVAPLAGDPNAVTAVAAADMDGDGLVDLVTLRDVASDTVVFSRALPGGGLASPAPIADVAVSFFGSFSGVLVSDIDQDQDLDIFLVSRSSGEVFTVPNLGGGSFGAPNVASPLQSNIAEPVIADIDGDGLLDIAHPFPNDVQWRRALGDGTFAERETLISASLESLAFADRNGDGLPDFVATRADGSIVGGTASGPAQFAGASGFTGPASLLSVSLADLSLDGVPDLIARTSSPDSMSVSTGRLLFFSLSFDPAFTLEIPGESKALGFTSIVPLDIDADGDLDLVLNPSQSSGRSFGTVIVENETLDDLGVLYCGPAVANSTGAAGEIAASGSASILLNQVELRASSLPPGQAGLFITSLTAGFVTGVPNSVGNLCLGGQIGRFVGPGQIGAVDSSGMLTLPLDLGSFPSPAVGLVPVQSGQTWNFQAWHRDTLQGQATSNFTLGLSVTFL